jgi:hypothetical protein
MPKAGMFLLGFMVSMIFAPYLMSLGEKSATWLFKNKGIVERRPEYDTDDR